jgi:NAD(P)-dependent dehydrogenase (short-subunit alcohol dehydrogenase family)
MPQEVVLVTGATTGIGRAVAARLAGAGYRVFGTGRNPGRAAPLEGVTLLPLDVTDDASVTACVAAVLAQAGRLDVLVNNAGIAVVGGVEEVTIEEARRQFETNFYGVIRMAQAALPGMRERRQGLVLNVSSVAGLMAIPFAGLYSASKHALEGLTESLRAELHGSGIRVALIEPGFFKSDLISATAPESRTIAAYDVVRGRVLNRLRQLDQRAAPPDPVADRVLELVRHPAPPLRSIVGREGTAARLKRFLPARMFEPNALKFWRVTG